MENSYFQQSVAGGRTIPVWQKLPYFFFFMKNTENLISLIKQNSNYFKLKFCRY